MNKHLERSISASSSEMSALSSFSGTSSFTNFSVSALSQSAMNQSAMNDLKTYLCSKCNRYYDMCLRNNVYVGRVPLILNCNHTMCEECVRMSCNKREILCVECQQPSWIDDKDKRKIQEIFPVNFYLLGVIYYSKPNMSEVAKINLKPAGVSYKNRTKSTFSLSNEVADSSTINQNILQEKCSQTACSKIASLRCADCDEVYCDTCCQTLHKAARGLQTHKVVPLSVDFIPELTDKCSVHKDSPLEFHCNTCTKLLCCYCVLQEHSGHSYYQLTYVNDSDRANFQILVDSAEEKLKKLIMAQKRVKWQLEQINSNTQVSTTEAAVAKYFMNLHARLQNIEKELRKDAMKAKNINLYTLNELNGELLSNIRTLNGLIGTAKNINNPQSTSKLNVKLVIERLENALGLPCYLVGEQQSVENIGFVCGDVFNNLEEYFTISINDSSDGFRLVGEDGVPEDYDTTLPTELSLLNICDIGMPLGRCGDDSASSSSIAMKSSGNLTPSEILNNALKPKSAEVNARIISGWIENVADTTKTINNLPSLKSDDRENVVVTHIDTPECFYVQLIRFTTNLQQLSKEIEQYIRNFAPVVKTPELNKLYIVKYETRNARPEWYRGRVIDIILNKNGETVFNILFIDYGNTQIVNLNKLRDINSTLSKPRPFALQCKLFNLYPVQQDWERKAMLLMAQIITGEIKSVGPSSGNSRMDTRTDVVMVVMSNSDGILEVDLLAISGGDMASIRDALIFVGHAVPCPNTDIPIVDLKMKSVKPLPKLHSRTDNFKKRQEIEVILSHVVDPHNIYIQIADFVHHIEHLSDVMGRYYSSKPSKGQIFGQVKGDNIYVPRKGMVVAVRCNDAVNIAWHRGTVTDIVEGQGMVSVFLVDSGRNVSISYTQIRRLPERFRNLDCQAILVKMADVKPKKKHEPWPPTAAAFLNKYIANKSKLHMLVIETGKHTTVALFERYASMDVCVNTMLVREGLAASSGEVTEKLEWAKEESSVKQESSTYVLDLLNTIQCSKKTNPEVSSDSEEEMETQAVIRKPVNILLTKSPDLIYVSLIDEASQTMQHDLHMALQDFYSKHHIDAKEWQVNDRCIVFNNKRKAYYRAIILEKVDDLNYKVMLRDIAEEILVSKGNMCILQSQFMQFREGSIRCHLAGIAPAGDKSKWSGLAIEFLHDTFEQNSSVFMTKSGPVDIIRKSLPVIMWYSEFKPGEALEPSRTVLHNINKLLIKNGLALKERPVTDSDSGSTANAKSETSTDTVKQKLPKEIVNDKCQKGTPLQEDLEAVTSKSSKHQKLGGSLKTINRFPLTSASKDTKTTFNSSRKCQNSKTPSEAEPFATVKDIELEDLEQPGESSVTTLKTAEMESSKGDEYQTLISVCERLSSSFNTVFDKGAPKHQISPIPRPKSTENFSVPYTQDQKRISVSDSSSPNFNVAQGISVVNVENKTVTTNLSTVDDWNELIERDESFTTDDVEDISNVKADTADWLPPTPFQENNFYAFATFVDDSACIYLHEAALEPVLKRMEEEMKAFFDKTPPEPRGTLWVAGQLCTVKYFVNESWYRGKVVSVSEEFIKVHMIDYGNEEECKHDDLRFKVMYLDLPAFANKILLYKVFPKVGSKWLTSDLDELHKKVVENKIFIILKGTVKPKTATPAVVHLDGVNINQFMLENSTNLVSYRQKVKENLEADSDVIIEEEQSDDMTEEELVTDGDESDLQFPLCQDTFIQHPLSESLVGQRVNVSVTSIIDYNHFIFEILTDQNVEETKTLFENISEDIRNAAHDQPVLFDLSVGQACVAKFSEDGEWYRGQVSSLENAKSGVVEIWFVDFGNSENVPRDTIRAIRPEWLKLPVLQYRGEIDGVELADPACLDIVVEYMAEFCNTTKSAEIKSIDPLRVRLYNDNDELAYQDLIDQNLLICKESELP